MNQNNFLKICQNIIYGVIIVEKKQKMFNIIIMEWNVVVVVAIIQNQFNELNKLKIILLDKFWKNNSFV